MSTLDLEPIKERLDKAHTEWGPWKAKEDSWDGYSVVIDDNGPGVSIIAEQIGQGEDEGRGDAEFIANAPEDIAALISEVERLRGQVEAVRAIHKPHRPTGASETCFSTYGSKNSQRTPTGAPRNNQETHFLPPESTTRQARGLRKAAYLKGQASMKRTTDNYFTGEIRVDAEGDYPGDVTITLGGDSYQLRSETAETLAAEIDWAVANGHYTEEDIDALHKAHTGGHDCWCGKSKGLS